MKTGLTKRQKTTCIYFDEAKQNRRNPDTQYRAQKAADTVRGRVSRSVQADRR